MRLVMMGTGSFAEPTFARLLQSSHTFVGLFTQPDRTTGRERGSTRQVRPVMKDLALANDVPIFQPECINTPEGIETLRSLQPDLLVVAAYGQILSREILASAKLGGINVHASLLPKYRGAAPINWAIYHGERQTGVTIIRMSISLDAGDILAQESLEILPQETAGELETRLGPLGAKLAHDVVQHLDRGPIVGQPQDKTQVTKAPKLTKELGLIDWTRSARLVCAQIYAMQPFPNPYTFLHRSKLDTIRLLVLNARITIENLPAPSNVGSLVADSLGRLLVQTGEGWVELQEVQPASKRRMSARDFLLGNSLPTGSRLGPEASGGCQPPDSAVKIE